MALTGWGIRWGSPIARSMTKAISSGSVAANSIYISFVIMNIKDTSSPATVGCVSTHHLGVTMPKGIRQVFSTCRIAGQEALRYPIRAGVVR
ncbi:MAG: hypothetical protein A3G17_07870 [Planctomycetes bacterium RIFCSPLOWO2_12_FULL_50_35]|nr:MAG: hypothetical protein A3G17_07870 [Planctomycetes bacterium RIFCSPLOWO2_12_FULL_50_35]